MKKVFAVTALLLLVFQCGCVQDMPCVKKEQPRLYWEDIDVVVEQVSRKHWFAGTHRYEVRIIVKSDEYNLTFTDVIIGSGMFRPKQWDYHAGDTVKAELCSWVTDSTGEVTKREINRVY